MLVSGDALGSGWPWIQWGPFSVFDRSVHHVEEITRPFPQLAVLPAHFYQVGAYERSEPPLSGRPLDRQYILDMGRLADGVLSGTLVGEPYLTVGRDTVWAKYGTARAVYALDKLYADGETPSASYHAIRIPGPYPRKWSTGPLTRIYDIHADFHLIRGARGETLYLLKGSRGALLIGAGAGEPGLAALVHRLIGAAPLAVALLDEKPDETAGLAQLSPTRIYVRAGSRLARGRATPVSDGDVIDLGLDAAGEPLKLEVRTFQSQGDPSMTLIATSDRILFAGDALGRQGADAGLVLTGSVDAYRENLRAWRSKTDGSYDILYTSHNSQWFTAPAYVDQLSEVVDRAATGKATDAVVSKPLSCANTLKSSGGPDVVASLMIRC
jgi:glyoxylase-like metal-dependent hydrolase (beta-lactamase superfamily II)